MRLAEKIGSTPIIRELFLIILKPATKIVMIVFNKLFGLDNKCVVFSSFGGRSYSDNPRAISERLHDINPTFKIVWLFQDAKLKSKITPSYVISVQKGTIQSLKFQSTAKYWVDNFKKPPYFYKNSNQIYIQTWHGDRGFKKVLFDNEHYPFKLNLLETDEIDLAITGSKFGENQFKSAMRYKGNFLKVGSPRNDLLIEKDLKIADKIKNSLNIDLETKILLFAPTFREIAENENKTQKIGNINIFNLLEIIERKTGAKWVAFIRGHYFVESLDGINIDNIKIFDGNFIEDMKELLLISDFLITDYSSCAGDFALLNRPIILFQPDLKEYIKNDRTLYFDIKDSPFVTANSQTNLISEIENLDFDNVSKNCKNILDFYGTYETGEASKEVARYIISTSLN